MKTVGYFKEQAPTFEDKYESIYDVVNRFDGSNELKDKIIEYLRSGVLVAVSPTIVNDVIDQTTIIGELSTLTDGIYQWPSDYVYYIEKYSLHVPKDFINHMQANKWKVDQSFDPEKLFNQD